MWMPEIARPTPVRVIPFWVLPPCCFGKAFRRRAALATFAPADAGRGPEDYFLSSNKKRSSHE
jgi:hypothetical protein